MVIWSCVLSFMSENWLKFATVFWIHYSNLDASGKFWSLSLRKWPWCDLHGWLSFKNQIISLSSLRKARCDICTTYPVILCNSNICKISTSFLPGQHFPMPLVFFNVHCSTRGAGLLSHDMTSTGQRINLTTLRLGGGGLQKYSGS